MKRSGLNTTHSRKAKASRKLVPVNGTAPVTTIQNNYTQLIQQLKKLSPDWKVDRVGVDRLEHRAQLLHERPRILGLDVVLGREWMDQVEAKAPQKELAKEAGLSPIALARRLGDIACLLLRRQLLSDLSHVRLEMRIVGFQLTIRSPIRDRKILPARVGGRVSPA